MSVIEVSSKPGFGGPDGGVAALARELGLAVDRAETAALYRLEGNLGKPELERIASELLSDPVTQVFSVDAAPLLPPPTVGEGRVGGNIVIDIWLKPQVADPSASSIERGARDLGFSVRARQGTRYRLSGRLNETDAKILAWKALANPVVHDCEIHAL